MKLYLRLSSIVCLGGLLGATAFTVSSDPVGCYLATPAVYVLGARDTGADTNHAVVALDSSGHVRWPHLSRTTRDASEWTVRGDSLFAWSTSGYGGWHYQLKATATGWEGVAHFEIAFETDRITPDNLPLLGKHPAVWIRRACP